MNKKGTESINRCTHVIGSHGKAHELASERVKEITATIIHPMADAGLRTICVAYKDYIWSERREAQHAEVLTLPINQSVIDWFCHHRLISSHIRLNLSATDFFRQGVGH